MSIVATLRVVRFVLAGVLSSALTTATAAEQPPRNYAVMSLIGDETSIVTYRASFRNNLDVNQKQAIAMTDDGFDRAAIVAADGAVIRTRSATESISLSSARSTNSRDPWDALTPEQKVRILRDLARLAIDGVMPQVVAPG